MPIQNSTEMRTLKAISARYVSIVFRSTRHRTSKVREPTDLITLILSIRPHKISEIGPFARFTYRFKIRQKCAIIGRFLCGVFLFVAVDLRVQH